MSPLDDIQVTFAWVSPKDFYPSDTFSSLLNEHIFRQENGKNQTSVSKSATPEPHLSFINT